MRAISAERDFSGFFGVIMTLEPFGFRLLSILDVCTSNPRGRQLHVKRIPQRFMTEISCVREERFSASCRDRVVAKLTP
jgi:hypothetical protein